jgi:hypothetical protein
MTTGAGVSPDVLARLRAVCLGLPEAHEEQAWVGTRWRVRTRTFAHVLALADGWPPAYARAAGTDGPCMVLTFRSSGAELDVLGATGHPFFRPPWAPDVVGMLLEPGDDGGVDWTEVTELLTDSYCVMAPRRLAALVERPPG